MKGLYALVGLLALVFVACGPSATAISTPSPRAVQNNTATPKPTAALIPTSAPKASRTPTTIPPVQSFSARIASAWIERTFAGNTMLLYVEVTEPGRLRNPRGPHPDTKAKLALIWQKNGNVLDEKIIAWTRNSPQTQGTNLRILAVPGDDLLYPSQIFGEYRNLQAAKQKEYEAARQQAQKNFLAGKPYVEVNAANYKVTDQEAVAIVSKYVKLLVALYID